MVKYTLEVDDAGSEGVKSESGEVHKLTEEEILMKKKEAYECWVPIGEGEKTIQFFLDRFVKKGKNCYCKLSGKRIYSIDLLNISQSCGCDLENAFYLQFYGKTKAQFEIEIQRSVQEDEANKKKERLEAIEKISGWIEEGKKYIDESKWQRWESYVNSSARGMYYGKDINEILQLLKLIEDGESWEKIQEIFDDRCDIGYFYSIVRNRVIYYSKKGEEAAKKLGENW